MGGAYARARFGLDAPTIGLLSNGQEPGKGDELRRRAHELLGAVPGFVGNVEGSDFMHAGRADVIVSDGFTGNVALKSMEGALRSLAAVVFGVLDATPETRAAATVVTPRLLEAAQAYDPDLTGGAVLLGVDGVCVISHGNSSARGHRQRRTARRRLRARRRGSSNARGGRPCQLRPMWSASRSAQTTCTG